MCRSVPRVVRHLDCKFSCKLTWEEVTTESILQVVGTRVWKYSYRLSERCTSQFTSLLQKSVCTVETLIRGTLQNDVQMKRQKEKNEFLVDDQEFLFNDYQWFPCRWWSTSSLSMIINDFRVVDVQRVPCRWWIMSSLSMMNNDIFVTDDQWISCRWSTSSLSMMISDFLVDDQWLPCRWSMTSLSLIINEFLFDDDQWLPCR